VQRMKESMHRPHGVVDANVLFENLSGLPYEVRCVQLIKQGASILGFFELALLTNRARHTGAGGGGGSGSCGDTEVETYEWAAVHTSQGLTRRPDQRMRDFRRWLTASIQSSS